MFRRIFCAPFRVEFKLHQHNFRSGYYCYNSSQKYNGEYLKNQGGLVLKCKKCHAYKTYHLYSRRRLLNIMLYFAGDDMALRIIHKLQTRKSDNIGSIKWHNERVND